MEHAAAVCEWVEIQPRARRPGRLAWRAWRGLGSAAEWVFGVVSLVVGLSVLAALPVVQWISFGYMLEASARVARSGRLRDGFVGVRKAARLGGVAVGSVVTLAPTWLIAALARSAEVIDPGGPIAGRWRLIQVVVTLLAIGHVAAACGRGGRLRSFLWLPGDLVWLIREVRRGGMYARMRDDLWEFTASLRLPSLFRLGLLGFVGTMAWLAPPAGLIALGTRVPPLGVLGAIWLAVIVPFLPFLQIRFALEGRFRALFAPRAVRERFVRAPWAFAFALLILMIGAVPLYLLKIEMIPREATWLPALVFVVFLMPARLLAGWAYARSARRERPRHWTFRVLGRLALIPIVAVYVLVVVLSPYISWGGAGALFEQHAFLLPVPFYG